MINWLNMFNLSKIKRSDRVLICSLLLFYAAISIYQWLLTGRFYWSVIGVAILSVFLIYLTSKRAIQKIIGEYPHSKRNKRVIIITWGLVVFLLLPFTYLLIEQLAKTELDIKGFAVFIIVPILFGYAVEISRIPTITQKTQAGVICVIKKLATSTVLFIIFFPLLNLINKLRIDINSVPDFHLTSIINGIYAWSMIFCFYVGLILFIFSVIDFVVVIKDLSIKK